MIKIIQLFTFSELFYHVTAFNCRSFNMPMNDDE